VSLHPADERMLDAAMAQLWGARFLSKILINTNDPTACWLWTASLTGTGYAQFVDREWGTRANRIACRLAHGEPPEAAPLALHSCDVKQCVRASHLRWGSHVENMADMVARGRALRGEQNKGGGKLTEAQVLEISALLSAGYTQSAIARRYGINQATVSMVNTGAAWGWLTGRTAEFAAAALRRARPGHWSLRDCAPANTNAREAS
jgi:hypothetical protein